MQIAVCDDNAVDRKIVHTLLQRYFDEKSVAYSIKEYDHAESLLYEVEDGGFFDLAILDIYMDGLLGIDAARRLRALGYKGQIVFLTTSPDFAVDGYDVGAAGYLLKPHSYKRLCAAMDRVLETVDADACTIRCSGAIVKIPYTDILYVESRNRQCVFHRVDGSCCTTYKPLKDVAAELSDPRFLRCHQSYLVNMKYIREANDAFLLVNGETVPIRQRQRRQLRQAYLDYVAQRGDDL